MTFPLTHPALARALAARDYSVPTAVQVAVLEPGANLRDLLVSAQTGSGKTVAFGMAIAPTLLGEAEKLDRAAEPKALIIAPTRELALQVQRELEWLYADTGARVITCVGGMDPRAEARMLAAGAHIVVGTPGRLRDHLERRRLDLSKLSAVVLDEADEMLDLGFREDLEFILDATPAERQTLLFSATMPREIEALARRYQRDAIRIETAQRNVQHADIEYRAIRVAPNDVEHAVVNVMRLQDSRATLVFCATREAVKRFNARLLERGFSSVALSGELAQAERTSALQALRDGRARVLVATDVAARGLDLPDLALVIHADLPNNHETLLHRSGRTGRAGKKGLCVLIVPFNRRRKAEALLGAARLKVTWEAAPTAEAILAKDQERFLSDPMFTDAATEDELAGVQALQKSRTADEIALGLLRMHRAKLPVPEDLAPDSGPPRREPFGTVRRHERAPGGPERREHRPSTYARRDADAGGSSDGASKPSFQQSRPRREDSRPMVWYRLNIGRERNADPRWILPLICKAGNVSKGEIGAIKIHDRDTRFQIVATFAEQFDQAVRTNKSKEGHIARVNDGAPAEDAPSATPPAEAPAARAAPEREARGDAHRPPAPARSERPFQDRGKPPFKDRGKKTGYPKRNREEAGAKSTPPPHRASSGEGSKPSGKPAHEKAGFSKPPFNKFANKKKNRPSAGKG